MTHGTSFDTIIIGAGFGGLAAAVRLKEQGCDDFVLLEKSDELGGTWQQNTYPGCACDVPTSLYSFSFALNPDWSRAYAPQPEIQAYLLRCADRFGLRPKVRLDTEVRGLAWDEASARWRVRLASGEELTSRFVVSAIGGLSRAALPSLPGLSDYQGKQFHSQKWDHGYSLAGKRVGVIGTGASAIQIVPSIAAEVGQLVVFQRTPPWILPRLDHPVSALRRWLYRWVPGFQRVSRWARYWLNELFVLGFLFPRIFKLVEGRAKKYLASQVADAALREKLEPNYRMGCKRILISDDYYPALQRPNVRLETTTIEKVTAKGVRTVDGVEHELDCLVLATGFHATDPLGPVEVLGRDRQSLRAAWADGLSAYLGTTVAGFPNLFMLAGPNTGIGHTSLVFMIEAQLHYALKAMRAVRRDVSGAVEVRADVQQQFNAALRERSKTTVWQAGGCRSWYLDEHGRNTTVWPGSTVRFWLKTRRFEPQAHVITLTPERAPAMESA